MCSIGSTYIVHLSLSLGAAYKNKLIDEPLEDFMNEIEREASFCLANFSFMGQGYPFKCGAAILLFLHSFRTLSVPTRT